MTTTPNWQRLKDVSNGTCTFPNCARKAARGRTTCHRHWTAGRNLKVGERADARRELPAALDAAEGKVQS